MARFGSVLLLAIVCGSAHGAFGGDEPSRISPEQLLAAIESGHPPQIIDVRSQREYDAGHVPGATHIPFYAVLARRAEITSRDEPLVVYCAHGPRAGMAKLQLWAAGFHHVRYLDGHMSAWNARGLPVETAAH
jgi:rhodanese-related sulfurtransferase